MYDHKSTNNYSKYIYETVAHTHNFIAFILYLYLFYDTLANVYTDLDEYKLMKSQRL